MDNEQLKTIAYHEAGHAIARIVLHRPFIFVTIIPDEENNTLGHIEANLRKRFSSYEEIYVNIALKSKYFKKLLENHIIILLSGRISEIVYLNEPINEHTIFIYEPDSHYFQTYLLTLSKLKRRKPEKLQSELIIKTAELIFTKRNWVAIERLANQLLIEKKIGYRKARRIVQAAWAEYDQKKGEA